MRQEFAVAAATKNTLNFSATRRRCIAFRLRSGFRRIFQKNLIEELIDVVIWADVRVRANEIADGNILRAGRLCRTVDSQFFKTIRYI